MSNFSAVISEVIRQGGEVGRSALSKVSNPYLSPTEKRCLEFIENHYKDYGIAPTEKTFTDEFKLYYTNDYKGEALPYLLEKYYKQLRNRALISMATEIQVEVGSGKVVDEETFISKIKNLPTLDIKATKDTSDEFDDYFNELYGGISPRSGFKLNLREYQDEEIGNLTAGRIFGILAHKKSGKTTVTSILACKAFLEGKKVLYLTYEMPKQAIMKKVHACLGKFNTKLFRAEIGTPEHDDLKQKSDRVKTILEFYKGKGGKLVIERGISFPRMRQMLLNEQKETGKTYDIVVVDGLYLVPADTNGEDKWRGVEKNMEYLRQLVMGDDELESFACLFSSQLDPKSEGKGVGIESTDIAKSRSLAETADVILAMVKDPDTAPNGRIITVLENRDGASGLMIKAEVMIDFETTMINSNRKIGASASMYDAIVPIPILSSAPLISEEDGEPEEEKITNEETN